MEKKLRQMFLHSKQETKFAAYNGDEDCQLIKHPKSSENPFTVLLLINGRMGQSRTCQQNSALQTF